VNGPDRIEEALKKLEPGAVPPHLMARLTAARPQAESRSGDSFWRGLLLRWLLPIAASACVAVGTFFLLERTRQPDRQDAAGADTVAEQRAIPMESQDYLVSARPVGIVVAPNQQPYRIMDVEWLEYQTVRKGADGPVLHTATTRRDVIPVALELY
jgi:hypothetical protein